MTENTNPNQINANTIPGHSLPPVPPKQKNQWWKKPIVFLPVITLALGMVIGGTGKPEPEVIEKPVDKIVEKRIEVKTTPNACLIALDRMEAGFDLSSEAVGYMQEALTATANRDVLGIRAATEKINDVSGRMNAAIPATNAAKAECRAAK